MTSRLIPALMLSATFALAINSQRDARAQAAVETEQDVSRTEPIDFVLLIDPDTAEQLKLTDAQRAALAGLVQRRAEARALKDADQQADMLREIQTELVKLLTPEQLRAFRSLPGQAKLTFSFREQPWLEVLDWFARQAGLALVVNEPPPGNFTYSDTKSYTPIEALDLLNGVLITRGFTLIRRERMLICADLTQGIPDGLIPRVRLEDLDRYGNFELVQVLFPLGAKPAQTVQDEITPLLDASGKATALNETKQLLVWSTAGKMRAISAVIASIPEPPKPKPPVPAPVPAKPELAIYPIGPLDPQASAAMVKSLVSSATLSIDERAGQINVFATPEEQQAIRKLLDNMTAQASGDLQLKLETYPLQDADPASVLQHVKVVLPRASITVDSDPPRLVVYATEADHKRLVETLAKLNAVADPTRDRRVIVFTLAHADPNALAETVRTLFPKIELVVDQDANRLIVIGDNAQAELIQQVVDRADSSQPRDLRSYDVDDSIAARIDSVLKPLVPRAQLTLENDQLIVVGSAQDHTAVKRILQQLAENRTAPPSKTLQIHTLTEPQRRRFMSTYRQLAPELEKTSVTEDRLTGALQIIATEKQHERFSQLLNDLKQQLPAQERRLQVYPVADGMKDRFGSLRNTLAPELSEIQIIDNPDRRSLLIVASESEHARVARLLSELGQALPGQKSGLHVLDLMPAQQERFLDLLPSMQNELGDLRIVDQSKPDELTVWATEQQINKARELLLRLKSTGRAAKQLAVYPLKHSDPTGVQTILSQLYSDVEIVVDVPARRVLVWTTADKHEQIGHSIGQLDTPNEASVRKMASYRLGKVSAEEVISLLQTEFPRMSMIQDEQSNAIVAWGTEADHQTLAKTIDEFRTQDSEPKSVTSYPCGSRDVAEVQRILAELVTDARLVADPENRAVVAWATARDHDTIQQAVLRMTRVADGSGGELRAYEVSRIEASDLLPLLKSTVPDAQLTASADESRVLAWATTEDHQTIGNAVRQLENDTGLSEDGSVKIYRSRPEVISRLRELVTEVAASAKTLAADQPDQLSVWADSPDHGRLAALVRDLDQQLSREPQELTAHPLNGLTAGEAKELVTMVAPEVQFLQSADRQQLLLRANPDDQKLIAAALQQLQQVKGAPQTQELRVYPLGDRDPETIRSFLDESLTVGLAVMADPSRNTLIVRAPLDRHADLRKAIDELLAKLPEPAQPSSRVHRFENADPESLIESLRQLLPDANFALDAATGSLIATAVPKEHQLIEQAVKQLDQPVASTRETRVYQLTQGDAGAARDVLQELLPKAVVIADSSNRALLVTAGQADQARVETIVKQLDQSTQVKRSSHVYRFRYADVAAAQTALQALLPDAIIAVDAASRALVATATPDEHEQIETTVGQLDVAREDPTVTRVYPFQFANVAAAKGVLERLLPNAVIATDEPHQILVATATEEEHAKISSTVRQMDTRNDRQPSLQAYTVTHADANSVFETLREMYDANPLVVISLDRENQAILAKAPAEDHLTIAQIVSRMDNALAPASARRLQAYTLPGGADDSVVETIRSLFDSQTLPAQLTLNPVSRQIIAVATGQQHELIQSAIGQMQGAESIVEVYPLRNADPFVVQSAIEQLYEQDADRPVANGDSDSQQLFVRGTQAQLEEIRKLLVKMGELPAEAPERKGLRVIPFRGDVERAVRQIEDIWPRLRSNKVEVIRLQAPSPVEPAVVPGNEPAADQIRELDRDSPNQDAEPAPNSDQRAGDASARQTRLVSATGPADDDPPATPARDSPSLIIVPGDGSITIMSQDEDALDQAAELLNTLARQNLTDNNAGNFAIFMLRNAGARTVAKLMDDLFQKMPVTTRVALGRVSIVADDRLNALVVHGRPADRTVIAELLKVLDSSMVPDSLANARPKIIQLVYADANRIIEILNGIYEAQLESGGKRPEISIPEGVSPEVASVLEQINAATSGPLLTLEVDDVTNSIVILAPRQLAEEVEKLIRQLEQDARTNDTRETGIIPLKSTNAARIQEALELLLQQAD